MGHHLLLTWAASALAELRCYDVRIMRAGRIAALCAALSVASACGSGVPTTPSDPSSGTGLTLPCSTPTLLAGDIVVCVARAGSVNVSTAAVWTSSDPSIARPEGIGVFLGKSEGQATLTATYDGRSASAQLTVHLQDVLRATASFDQGPFRVGAAATMGLQGFYGVASANSGRLTLVITDQDGATVKYKCAADSSSRRRQVSPHNHVHRSAEHHACVSNGSPSDRIDHADCGSGRLARALYCSDAVSGGSMRACRPVNWSNAR